MRIYHYAPSVNVYAAVRGDNGDTYYDLTEDVSSCTVNRVCDSFSSFTITLLNRGLKYNNLFSPFDRIVIVANKGGESYRLLTGYITKTDVFTLYEKSFKIEGKDTLYRLAQLWFDPGIFETRQTLSLAVPDQVDSEGWRLLHVILTEIAGWPENMIKIEQRVPESVIAWARRLYSAQKADYEQSEHVLQEMFQALMNTSTIVSGGSSVTTTFSNQAGGVGKATNADVERAVQWALAIAADDTHGYSLDRPLGDPDYCCASLVTAAFAHAGFGVDGNVASCGVMINDFTAHGFEFIRDPSLQGIQRGDIIIIAEHEHTELYLGGDEAVGAHWNYDGRAGDSGGKEISIMKYNRDKRGYMGYLHWPSNEKKVLT